jgi:hypothetical protein
MTLWHGCSITGRKKSNISRLFLCLVDTSSTVPGAMVTMPAFDRGGVSGPSGSSRLYFLSAVGRFSTLVGFSALPMGSVSGGLENLF